MTDRERFDKKVIEGDHWMWTGATINGYPVFRVNGKQVQAARWFYEQCDGPIPKGYALRFRCGEKLCVRKPHKDLVKKEDA